MLLCCRPMSTEIPPPSSPRRRGGPAKGPRVLLCGVCALGGGAALLAGPPCAHAQAEPAPPGSVPSPPPPPLKPQVPARVRVAGDLRFSGLFGEAQEVAAPLGWGFGLQLSASLLPLGPLRLGFVLDF